MGNRDTEVALNSDVWMPKVGFGTWKLGNVEVVSAVERALETGYRLIDTASYYQNESGVGTAVNMSGIPRSEVFITSKIRGSDQGYDKTTTAIETTLEKLRFEYVDLLLIHWPLPLCNSFVDTWIALIEAKRNGKVRAIGVSNFNRSQIETLINETGVKPTVNQVQCNPFVANSGVILSNQDLNIFSQSWEPLGAPQGVLKNARVVDIARRHDKTEAQVVLRWHLQSRRGVIPKSSNPSRIYENFQLMGWHLDIQDMLILNSLDCGDRWRIDPNTNYVM